MSESKFLEEIKNKRRMLIDIADKKYLSQFTTLSKITQIERKIYVEKQKSYTPYIIILLALLILLSIALIFQLTEKEVYVGYNIQPITRNITNEIIKEITIEKTITGDFFATCINAPNETWMRCYKNEFKTDFKND